jgi:hypothetical protein
MASGLVEMGIAAGGGIITLGGGDPCCICICLGAKDIADGYMKEYKDEK